MRRYLVPSALAVALVAGLAARAAAYEAMAVTDGGTLSGTVKFQGTPPPPAKLEVSKDPEVCGKEKMSPDLVVGSDGALVLLFPAGSTVDVLNSDGILHNIHTFGTANPPSNQAQPKFKPKIQIKVEKPETIPVKCDVHGWMSAWWVATDQPYVALTDATGAFKITDLPPGDYEVELWQEKLGKKTEKVSIKPKEETKVAWSMSKA